MNQTPADVSTAAYNWVLQRSDGVGLAATSHDCPQQLGGVTHEPDLDLQPGELLLTDVMFGSMLSLKGGISNPSVTPDDLVAGRWNGASVQLLASDWNETNEATPICEGEFGKFSVSGGDLSISVALPPTSAKLPPCVQTSPECRAVLGDQQCRVDMRSRQQRVRVVSVTEDGVVIEGENTQSLSMGRLRWISGANCGLEQIILSVEGSRLVLQDASRLMASVGDRAIVRDGCDGLRQTCSQKFGNILNFRGEPDLPGSEILLRFPGA